MTWCRNRYSITGLLFFAACAPTPPVARVDAELLRREAAALPESAISESWFSARARVRKVGAVKTGEDHSYVRLDFGGVRPADCWFYRGDIDLASTLEAFSEGGLERVFATSEARQIQSFSLDAEGASPVLGVDWLYRTGRGSASALGQLKLRLASKGDRALACVHAEPGFRSSFDRMFRSLVSSLEYVGDDRREAYYEELYAISADGLRNGFQRVRYLREGTSDTVIQTRTSQVLSVGPAQLQVYDTYLVEHARRDGRLVHAALIESVGSELSTRLTLELESDGTWRLSGRYRGRDLQLELGSEAFVLSSLGERVRLRQAVRERGAGAELAYRVWLPAVDPTRFADGRVAVEELEPGSLSASYEMGGVRTTADLDADGLALRALLDSPRGPQLAERLHVNGSF